MIKWLYLFQLAGLDDGGVTVLVVGQAEQDVVTDGPRHDPGGLWREGDAAAVPDFSLWRHQLPEDHHEQGALREKQMTKHFSDGGDGFGGVVIFLWRTFPEPVDPATANIWPFSRYTLMFFSTGVT